MTTIRKFTFIICGLSYSAGFWILEVHLQRAGCQENIIAAVACVHNLISALFCSYVFWKSERHFFKYTWAPAFAVVGVADLIHGLSRWVYPLDPVSPLATVFGEMYTVLLVLLLAAFYKSFEKLGTRPDMLVGAVVTGFFCSIMLIYVSAPLWKMDLPWYLDLFEAVYTILSSVIISVIFVTGLRARFPVGLFFLSFFMLIFCSDFAIRFYDNSTTIPQLSLFNYGWELGFSLLALLCLWLRLNNIPLNDVFQLYPYNSLRFEVACMSFIALTLFALLFIITSNRALIFSAQDVSLMLSAFLLSWFLSNTASLWISSNLNTVKRLIAGENAVPTRLNIEISDLLSIYQSKNDRLAAAMETIGRQKGSLVRTFSYIAHDMRSPLSVLKSYISSDKEPSDDEAIEYRAAAGNSVEKLLRMADGLLDYSKAAKIDKSSVDLKKGIISTAILEVQGNAAMKGSVLRCDSPDEILANLDPHKMGRVMVNLMNNAVQAIGHGGGVINISVAVKDEELTIVIADNGKGIDKDHIPHIFDNFYSVGKSGGVGLGLSYCMEVVNAHGGTIGVESEIGKGTKFTIKIPDCVVRHYKPAFDRKTT